MIPQKHTIAAPHQTLSGSRIDLFVDVVPVAFFTDCWLVQRLIETVNETDKDGCVWHSAV